MKTSTMKMVRAPLAAGLLAFALLGAGCAGKKEEAAGFATPKAAVVALVQIARVRRWMMSSAAR